MSNVGAMGVLGSKTGKTISAGDFRSPEELIAAYESLPDADKLKLDRIESIRRGGTSFKRGELLHKAMCGAIFGERRCPRDVGVVAFLAQTMRSIASHERERLARTTPLHEVSREGEPAGQNATSVGRVVNAPAVSLADSATQSKVSVDDIFALFADDETTQLILLGWIDNCRGQELRELTGLSQSQLDYKIRCIRAKAQKKYPNGWKP